MGGNNSGRKSWVENPKPRHTKEYSDRFLAKLRSRRAAAEAEGLCIRCFVREAEPDPVTGRGHKTCVQCRDAAYVLRTEPPKEPWCDECLTYGHREGCKVKLDEDTRNPCCNRAVAMIEKRLADLQAQQSQLRSFRDSRSEPSATGDGKTPPPATVESGRSRDEGLPESGLGVDFSGIPTS